MKKIWGYIISGIALFLAGFSSALLIARKTAGDTYSAYIKRIRQRGKEGSSETVVFKPVLGTIDGTSRTKSSKPITKRKQRKIDRQTKRAEKRLT